MKKGALEEGLEKGREEGFEKGILQVAKAMKANGASVDFIVSTTGLS